jgi:hypothetical protein
LVEVRARKEAVMGDTTTYTRLSRIQPISETEWRAIAARAHRLRATAGDESAALTHESTISDIRSGTVAGSSRGIRFCPRCLERGHRYILIFMKGKDCCGTCGWPQDSNPG